ncbi:ribosomal RNA-processing protein 7 [Artemisia annua]|uniref:Ribosomal RNA-processing protein 7 n=1 Tax=Artemisia annua TaxID=35608 RepID=A0A2U1KNC9_ARTAN|nr:ribosomal RNA-processing protein 7 [Artemisia annua]
MDVAKSNKKVKKVSSNKKRKGTDLPEAETTQVVVSTDAHESKTALEGETRRVANRRKRKEIKKVGRKIEPVKMSHIQMMNTSQIDNAATLFGDEDEVYEMSLGDEDETTGMKKVLMKNIDDFLVDYATQKEREKKEREEEAAEGGWTFVTHIKGRKKTTEAESGTTVGSVAPAAVMDKLSKKKDKQVGLNFYRFQKREAQRNEIMMLQSKFEQDKKRIQELRAARKFRPY